MKNWQDGNPKATFDVAILLRHKKQRNKESVLDMPLKLCLCQFGVHFLFSA